MQDTNGYALELLHDTVCAAGIPGWVCLLCRHKSTDTGSEREQVVDVTGLGINY